MKLPRHKISCIWPRALPRSQPPRASPELGIGLTPMFHMQVFADRECDLFDRQRCDIGDVNRLGRPEFAEEGAVR